MFEHRAIKVLWRDMSEQLRQMSADGWELVAATVDTTDYRMYALFFKKAIQ